MSNFLEAVYNICSSPVTELKSHYLNRNKINHIGDSLEVYIQDAFSNSIQEGDPNQRKKNISEAFSYLGNASNPPDIILKNGPAVEVKKIQNMVSDIALNSSPPKNKLYSTDTRITKKCRQCENTEWREKDLIYVVGTTSDSKLKHIWLVYGDCYAADKEIYSRISSKIKEGIEKIPDVELTSTNELGKLNNIDPLGISYLRVRGMWGIKNPMKVYSDIYSPSENSKFSLAALVSTKKYNSFPEYSRLNIEREQSIDVNNVDIRDPNNPAKLIAAKLITYTQL